MPRQRKSLKIMVSQEDYEGLKERLRQAEAAAERWEQSYEISNSRQAACAKQLEEATARARREGMLAARDATCPLCRTEGQIDWTGGEVFHLLPGARSRCGAQEIRRLLEKETD